MFQIKQGTAAIETSGNTAHYRYVVELSAQIGKRIGCLDMSVQSGACDGTLYLMEEENPVSGSVDATGSCHLHGLLRTFTRTYPFTAQGMLDAERIDLQVRYENQIISLHGTPEGA